MANNSTKEPLAVKEIFAQSAESQYSVRQKCLSASFGIAFSCATTAALAHETMPFQPIVTAGANHVSQAGWTTHHGNQPTKAAVAPTTTGLTLNLGSAAQNFSVSQLGSFNQVTIDVGGKSTTLNLQGNTQKDTLTAAEFLAAADTINGTAADLTINYAGIATGGSVTSSGLATVAKDLGVASLGSLVVPNKVTLIDNSNLTLTGNLVNYGKVSETGKATISDNETFNSKGALIVSGNEEDLSLTANILVNQGIIAAGNNLNLNVPTVTNSGTLSARTGNVNFQSAADFLLTNGGTVRAGQNVNIREASYAGPGNINITGGTIDSKELNLNSGTGTADVSGSNVTGIINTNAASAHVITDSQNLMIGNTNVSGDPLFANQGNIIINGTVIGPQNGAPLSFVASGNILSAGGSIDTSNATGNGGQLNLIAGADFTSQGPNQVTVVNSTLAGGGSATGGLIDLTGGNGGSAAIAGITTAATGVGANAGSAGNITMAAFAGSAKGSGTIATPATMTINASAADTGTGGNVTILAGATKGTAISVGNINASSGANTFDGNNVSGPGGVNLITLSVANPAVSALVITGAGGITGGTIGPGAVNANGNIVAGNIYNASSSVQVSTGGGFTFQNIDVSGYGGNPNTKSSNPGFAYMGASGAGNVSIVAKTVAGNNIYAYGGGGGGGNDQSGGAATKHGDGGNGGNGGQISISNGGIAAGAVALSGQINVAGGGGGGGAGQDSQSTLTITNPGAGGNSGTVAISSTGNITVGSGIFAADGGGGGGGASGGKGQAYDGGSGGGSVGAGGGGGASGLVQAVGNPPGQGGGGGGGLFGGGGGGTMSTDTGTASTGGAGAGFATAGAGFGAGGAGGAGDVPGTSGGSLSGGSATGGAGGAYGQAGVAGAALSQGSSAFLGGQLFSSNTSNPVQLTTTGLGTIGTAKLPLQILSYGGTLDGTSAFISIPGSSTSGAGFTTTLGSLSVNTGAGASNVILNETSPTNTFNLLASNVGAGSILTIDATVNNFIVQGPVAGGSGSGIFLTSAAGADLAGALQIEGVISNSGASAAVVLQSAGAMTTKGAGLVSSPLVDLTASGFAAIGTSAKAPFNVDSGALTVVASTAPGSTTNAFLSDTNTGTSNFTVQGTFGTLTMSSPASQLNVKSKTLTDGWDTGTFTNTSKNGNIDVSSTGLLTGFESTTFSTVNGNITSSSGNFAIGGPASNGTLTLISAGGSIGTSGSPFGIVGNGPAGVNLAITTKGTAVGTGQAFFQATGDDAIVVNNASAPNALSITGPNSGPFTPLLLDGPTTSTNGIVTLTGQEIFTGNLTSNATPANQLVTGGTGVVLVASGAKTSIGAIIDNGVPAPVNFSVLDAAKSQSATLTLTANRNVLLATGNSVVNLLNSKSAVGGELSISNAKGSMAINGDVAFATAPQKVSYSAAGNLTISDPNVGIGTTAGTSVAQNVVLSAGKILNLAGVGNTVSASTLPSGTGGTINVTAGSLVLSNPASPLTLDTNGAATGGAGGTVTVNMTGKQAVSIGTPTLTNASFVILANGFGANNAGGTVSFQTGGTLAVDPASVTCSPALLSNGNGGNLTLNSKGAMSFTPTILSTSGDGTGLGGNLNLSSGSSIFIPGGINVGQTAADQGTVTIAANGKNFLIGGASAANGSNGTGPSNTIIGSSITISNSAGITVNTALGIAGDLTFNTTSLTNNATPTGNLVGFTVNSGTGSLIISGSSTDWGSPTSVSLVSGGKINTGPLFTGNIFAGTNVPLDINIAAGGLITLGVTTLTASSSGASPGAITIDAAAFALPAGTTTPLTLQANSTTGGDGSISFTLTGKAQLNVTSAANVANSVVADIETPSSTAGGSVFISNGGNLIVKAAALNSGIITSSGLNAAISTNVSLLAGQGGSGLLQVNNFGPPVTGPAGNVVFASNSSTPFVVVSLTPVPSNGNGVQVSIGAVLVGNSVIVSNSGGGIGTSAVSTFTVDAPIFGATAGKTGSVFVSESAPTINLLGSSAGGSYNLFLDSGMATSVTAGGAILAPSLTITDQTVAGTLATFGGTLSTNATTLQATLSAAGATLNVSDFASKGMTVNTTSIGTAAGGSLNITSAAGLTINGGQTADNLTYATTNGNIVVSKGATVGDSTSTTTLSAGGTGTIMTAGNVGAVGSGLIEGASVTLQTAGGAIGGSTAVTALNVTNPAAQTLSFFTSGAVNVADGSTATTTINPVLLPVGSFSFASATTDAVNGGLILGSLTSAGGISLVNTSSTGEVSVQGNLIANNGSLSIQTSGGDMNIGTAGAVQVLSTNGNIVLQDIAASGTIRLGDAAGDGVILHASSTASKFGFVTIAADAPTLPTSKQLQNVSGNLSGATITNSGTGQVQISNAGGAAVSFLAGSTLNALGRNLVLFNGNQSTNQIAGFKNISITADPPVSAANSNSVSYNQGTTLSFSSQSPAPSDTGRQANVLAIDPAGNPAISSTVNSISGQTSNSIISVNRLADLTMAGSALGLDGGVANTAAISVTNTASTAISSAVNNANNRLVGAVSKMTKRTAGAFALRELREGALLISADRATLVKTSMGTISVAKGALALVIADQHNLSIYNLDDVSEKSVVVRTGTELIVLRPGRHISIDSSNSDTFESVNPVRTLGYRNVVTRRTAEGLKLHTSEFSLISAIGTIRPLALLAVSPDKERKKVGQHLLKTTAIINSLSFNSTRFETKTVECTAMR